ncbi:hypothetical protein RRG08_051472 [Elysia crispata]|uniref:Uncharacterized protein n=1 Tax=Elysia crispata TaxID=231223 RepID=A0AAE1B3G7_9GAST|nr:hypothetical protein RRG08_051472 [Elysia crispata]
MVRLRRQPYLSRGRANVGAKHTVKERMWSESFEQALRRTTPEDVWVCSTNALGGQVQTSLHWHHKANYPRLLRPRYASIRRQHRPLDTRRPGQLASGYTRESREGVNAFTGRGTVVQVPLRIVEKGLPLEWKYAGWGTVHRVQGKTLAPPSKLFIVDHSLSGWVFNAVYTAVSRVRLLGQIVRVLPPGGVKGPFTPTAQQATPSRALI